MIVVEENVEDCRVELSKEEVRHLEHQLNARDGNPPGGARVQQELTMQIESLAEKMENGFDIE